MRSVILALLAIALLAPRVHAIDDAHKAKARAMEEKAIAWLRAHQDGSGGWSVNPKGPAFPAITGLALNGMLMHPGVNEKDESVKKGVGYILKYKQPDGGIYDTILPSYNSAICLSALARVNTPEAKAAIKPAQDFLPLPLIGRLMFRGIVREWFEARQSASGLRRRLALVER